MYDEFYLVSCPLKSRFLPNDVSQRQLRPPNHGAVKRLQESEVKSLQNRAVTPILIVSGQP
jgi:hypothetical protein